MGKGKWRSVCRGQRGNAVTRLISDWPNRLKGT